MSHNPESSTKRIVARLFEQFSKFVAVGLLNTGIDFALLNILMAATGITSGVGIGILNTVSFTAATLNSYLLNKRWTFGDRDKTDARKKFIQFVAVSAIGAAINGGTVYLVSTFVPPVFGMTPQLWANVAKIFATGFSLTWNFLGYKFFVFKR